ncbi:hypothetical protein [uncultured Thiodictyon sp.]|uniref:hypothetical protein n=1 Tax=uncultured Thiodictyon sp. TaxID=1846217 RepID=UPI0025EAC651|nr:hypothetical protein [uncultured Thiodictyon sp.]
MIIHCMYCGHTIDLSEAYDDYQGPVRCAVCKSLMMVRVENGQLRGMDAGPAAAAPAAPKAAAPAAPKAATAKAAPPAALKARPASPD